MNRRKLTALALTSVVATFVGLTAAPAYAAQRTFVVTMVGGAQVTLTLDIPVETPADEVAFPGLDLPMVSVQEVTAPTGTPTTSPTTPPLPTVDAPPAPTSEAGGEPVGAPGSDGDQQSDQDTVLRRPSGEQGTVPDLVTALEEQNAAGERRTPDPENPGRNEDGSPTPENPAFSLAMPGAAPLGVPNFFIDKFRIPPFLLPIYQAAGIEYGVRWEVLAAINEIETDYGRNLNVSSAGALGWMQFIPSSWKAYGVDANGDGFKDPYNPVDAIFAAARYLKAAGADTDIRRAVFAYNHADWYVDSVLLRARVIGGLPSNFVSSLTGLTQGRFPVAARATYADDLAEQEREERYGVVESSPTRREIDVFAREDAQVIAVNDGRILKVTDTSVELEDVYGNTYTYTGLGSVAEQYPVAREDRAPAPELDDEPEAAPDKPASDAAPAPTAEPTPAAEKVRLFANPDRGAPAADSEVFRRTVSSVFGANTDAEDLTLKPLEAGSRVVAGTVLGRIGKATPEAASHLTFAIRPAGRGAPQIDPKPILDGWKLLETTAIYRAAGRNPFSDSSQPSIGQVLLMDKSSLQRLVLADPRIEIYGCGREDIQLGQVDRRVLATLAFLSASGFKPSVTSLRCGHSFYTSSGNVSHHSSGNAVDIAEINGVPILGHQGSGRSPTSWSSA